MQPSEELQIRKAIESGDLSPSMELQARRAIDSNAEDVSELITNISGGGIPSYRRSSFEDIISKTKSKPGVFKGFASEDVDTESGIQNAGLRAELS